MFTGIIEEIGTLLSKIRRADVVSCSFKASKVLEGTKVGDSIAVDGVCLTVTELNSKNFSAQVMTQTWTSTSLKYWRIGQLVNLERALVVGDRLDGHIVQGHVEGVGKVKRILKTSKAYNLEIAPPAQCKTFIVPKGSIAINGVSLTVQAVRPSSFTVAIIPHTTKVTTLQSLRTGSLLNLETDVLHRKPHNIES